MFAKIKNVIFTLFHSFFNKLIIFYKNIKLICQILIYSISKIFYFIYNLKYFRKLRNFYFTTVLDRFISLRYWIQYDRTSWDYLRTRIFICKISKVLYFFYKTIKICLKVVFFITFAPLVVYYYQDKINAFLVEADKVKQEMDKKEVVNFHSTFVWFKVYFINIIKIRYPKFFVLHYHTLLQRTIRAIYNEITGLIWNITTPINPLYYWSGQFKKDLKIIGNFCKIQIKELFEEIKQISTFIKNVIKTIKKNIKQQRRFLSYLLFKPGYYNTFCVAMIVLQLRLVLYSLFIIYVLIDFAELHTWMFPDYHLAKGEFFLQTLIWMIALNALQVYLPVFLVNVLKEDSLYKISILYNQSNEPRYENPRFIFYLAVLRQIKLDLKFITKPLFNYINVNYYGPFMSSFYRKVTPITDKLFDSCVNFCVIKYNFFNNKYIKFKSLIKNKIFNPLNLIFRNSYIFIKNNLKKVGNVFIKIHKNVGYKIFLIKLHISTYLNSLYLIKKIYQMKRRHLNAFKYFKLKDFILSKKEYLIKKLFNNKK